MAGHSDSLRDMRSAVKGVKPNADVADVTRSLNERIRSVCHRRAWSDLIGFGTVGLYAPYETGTVSVSTGSNEVTGVDTAWPVDDDIDTHCDTALNQIGYVFVKPDSMANIVPGKYLLVNGGEADEEVVVVEYVRVDAFIAKFAATHTAPFTITASSFAGRQFQTTYPIFTIKAVVDATHLLLDMNWVGPAQSAAEYRITSSYVQIDPYAWWLKFAWDPEQGIQLETEGHTFEEVIRGDPQMRSSGEPTWMVPAPPAAGGVAQWLVYPPPSAARMLSVVYVKHWPKLVVDEDRTPPFIDSTVFADGARADVLRIRVIASGDRQDPYFDAVLANVYEKKFDIALELAEQADQANAPDRLLTYSKKGVGGMSADYMRSHPWV